MEKDSNWVDVEIDEFIARRNALWTKPDKEIHHWVVEAVRPGKSLSQFYRIFGSDLDGDLAQGAEALRRECEQADASLKAVRIQAHIYELRLIWRVLLRNYAFCEAMRVGRVLRDLRDPWIWRLWRFKDLLLPRLAMGVFAGFLLLSAGSLTVDILQGASRGAMFWWVLGGAAVLVFGFAVFDVQRRVGRRPWTVIAGRALVISALGLFYSFVGGLITYYGGWSLGFRPSASHIVLCSAASLLLGFIFQLFAQERSIGDPL
jgi:hypothetical protein